MKRETTRTKRRRQRIMRRRERRLFKKQRRKRLKDSSRAGWFDVAAPPIFCLHDRRHHEQVIAFAAKLRDFVVRKSRDVIIDFTRTERMFSDGTLLLKAELSRILRIIGNAAKIKCRPPENKKVSQVLQQVGIYDLLRYRSHVEPSDNDVICWRHSSGTGARGEEYERVLGALDEKISSRVQTGLYDGIVEAMTNANHHAYEMLRLDDLDHRDSKKEWWMFSQVKDDHLSVSFCDLGIGIPRSLPLKKKWVWARLIQVFGGKPPDGSAIKAAVEESRSRTGLQHRGKGLRQLVAAIDRANEGHLLIYSNAGCYSCRKSDKDRHEKDFNYKGSILGTLICWTLPLDQEERSNAD